MKIDFKQLAKIEKQYQLSDNPISLNTLQSMVDQVIAYNTNSILSKEGNIALSVETLKDLGILMNDNQKDVQMLKS